MICKELGDQVDTIKYDLEQGDYISAGIHAIQLLVIIFSIMAQCFTGETEVMTDEGLVVIEDIEVGDYVLAEDTVTGEQEYKEVLNVFVSQTNKLVYVTTTDSESGTTINTTDNHPFYVEGKGWVPAIELEAGDVLKTADGEIETVSKVEVEYLDEAVLIYNLEVEGYHTYFVSDESVLVHNTYDAGDGGNGNSEGGKTTGSYGELVSSGQKDAHHIIQDAAMRDVPGYDRFDAPAVQLDGPSNVVGTEHYYATVAQRRMGGGTYGAERGIAYMSLRKAGLSVDEAKAIVRGADKYFMDELGLTLDSPTRIPGNRRK